MLDFSKAQSPTLTRPEFRDGLAYLAGLTEATVEASRVRAGQVVAGYPPNSLGFTAIRPGGRACYPAIWTQDFCMTLASGFVTDEEALNHLLLVASRQHGPEARRLGSGATIPSFAIPDHITFDGRPIYFPGTYSSGEDQGGEPWGLRPPANNHFDFIAIAHDVYRRSHSVDFLRQKVDGLPLWERLIHAFSCPETDPITGLVQTEQERRAVGFIFCDSIYMTGSLLFASLLRRRAGLQMAELAVKLGEPATFWIEEADRAKRHIPNVFADPRRMGGWLMAATGIGRQPDVWGTIFALFQDVLPPNEADAARAEIVKALADETILFRGAVRHVPTNHDARADSAWERTLTPHNTYQNGAYWHTPTGWLVAVLWNSHHALAVTIFAEMIVAFQEGDFRKGEEFNAPWECIGRTAGISQNPLFLASVTTPFGVLKSFREHS